MLRSWFSGRLGSAVLRVQLYDLKGLFQPMRFCDFKHKPHSLFSRLPCLQQKKYATLEYKLCWQDFITLELAEFPEQTKTIKPDNFFLFWVCILRKWSIAIFMSIFHILCSLRVKNPGFPGNLHCFASTGCFSLTLTLAPALQCSQYGWDGAALTCAATATALTFSRLQSPSPKDQGFEAWPCLLGGSPINFHRSFPQLQVVKPHSTSLG